jgi:hypothetical protein
MRWLLLSRERLSEGYVCVDRPAQFVDRGKKAGSEEFDEADEPEGGGARGDTDDYAQASSAPAPIIDMLSLDDPPSAPTQASHSSNLEDLLGLSAPAAAPSKPAGAHASCPLCRNSGICTLTHSYAKIYSKRCMMWMQVLQTFLICSEEVLLRRRQCLSQLLHSHLQCESSRGDCQCSKPTRIARLREG